MSTVHLRPMLPYRRTLLFNKALSIGRTSGDTQLLRREAAFTAAFLLSYQSFAGSESFHALMDSHGERLLDALEGGQ